MAVCRIARYFLLVLTFGTLAAAAKAADDDSLAIWRREKLQAQSYLKSFRPLGTLHIQDLFQLRRSGPWLELASHAADMGDSPMTASFDDIAGSAEVYIHHRPGTNVLDRFDVNLMDFPTERRTIELRVHYEADRSQLTISQSNQNAGLIEQVMLVQSRPVVSGPSNFIQLSVSTSSLNNAQSDQLTFSSSDFASFVQTRPDETTRYLRPLFRQLSQEMVFAPDQRIAEQVFGALRRTDPGVQKQVADLLPKLNDPSFHVRSDAAAKLKALGRAGADVLDRMDRSALSPEQNVRVGLILAKYDPLSTKELARLRQDPTFLLDCLYSDQGDIRWAALEVLRNTFAPTLDFDADAPEDVRSAAIASLRRKLAPSQ